MRKKPEFTVVRGTHVSEFERRYVPRRSTEKLTMLERVIFLFFIVLYGYAVIRLGEKLIRYCFEA